MTGKKKNLTRDTSAIIGLEAAGKCTLWYHYVQHVFAEELSDGGERNEMAKKQANEDNKEFNPSS